MGKSDWIRKKNNAYVLYSWLFLIVCFISFLPFLLRGNSLVPNADGYNQTFPVFVYCREFWMGVLKGQVSLWDFVIGLGDDTLFTLHYYGLFDVLSVFSSLIFSQEYIEIAYCFSIVLRLYLCGIVFILFSKRYIYTENYMAMGALIYGFNIYGLFRGMNFYPFLNGAITFPLLLYGMDELLEQNRKISIVMIVALWIQGLNGFYLLYIECILAIVYFLFVSYFRLYRRGHENAKFILYKMLNIAYNGLLGVVLSGVVLLPSIISLFSSTREMNGKGFTARLFCGVDTFLGGIGDLFIPNVYNTVSTLSIIAVGGMISYIFIKSAKKEFQYLPLILWILLWSPCWGSIMNGFSYSANRWIFSVAFFTVFSTVLALDSGEKMPITAKKIYVLVVIIASTIHIIQNERNIGLFIRMAVFVGLAFLVIYVWDLSRKREATILILGTLITICMGLFTFGPKILGGCGYSANFKNFGVYEEIKNSVADITKTKYEFERWDVYNSSLSAALIGNYYGTSEYFSMLNAYVSEFYQEMFISPGIKVSSFCLRGLDGRQEIESLLSVSKYMDFTTDRPGEQVAFIKDNEYFIPLGFTYDSYVLREEFEKLNPMDKYGQILNTLVLEDEYANYKKEEIQEANNLKINYRTDLVNEEESIRVYLNQEDFNPVYEEGNGEVYVSFHELHGDGYFYVGNKEIEMKDSSNIYYTGIEEFWVNVSEIKRDENGCYFEMRFDGVSDFDVSKMNIYWHKIDHTAIKERQKNTLSNLQILINQITGEISCSKDELLFMSIPYSVGWSAYVDGEEVDIMKANIGFMAIPLEEGTHTVELFYETPGLKVGAICSLVSLLIIIVNIIYIRKNKRNGEIE